MTEGCNTDPAPVGMFEHAGTGHYREYSTKVAALLKGDGVALIHTIANITEPASPHPWFRKYIFPGSYIPSLSEITPANGRSGLVVTDVEVFRLHYGEFQGGPARREPSGQAVKSGERAPAG